MLEPIGKCVARTKSIEEARAVAKNYELDGFKTKIFEKGAAGLIIYEVWTFKKQNRSI